MKRIITLLIISIAPVVTTVHADNRQHQGMGMMDKEQVQHRFQEMQQMMDRVDASKNADERRQLMVKHMKKMREMMADMHDMMGQGMMNQGMMGQGMMGQGMMGKDMMQKGDNGMKDKVRMGEMPMDQWQQMMGMRMDMMQGMMEQMLEQMMYHQGQRGMKK
jgi:hypothetical protein